MVILTTILTIIIIILTIFFIIKTKEKSKLLKKVNYLNRRNSILKQYNQATKTSNIISNGDLKGNITYVNDRFCEVSQYTREEIIGKPHSILRGEENSKIFKEMWDTLKSGKVWRGILRNTKKDGTFYYINSTISPIFDENGKIFEYVAIRHEITDIVEKSDKLNKILKEDYLTGVGSRHKLIEDIFNKDNLSLSLIDIDNFSEINDYFGYEIGDTFLKLVAKEIEKLIKEFNNYKLYRVNSDVFAILVDNEDRNIFVENIEKIVRDMSKKYFSANKKQLYIRFNYYFSFEEKSKILETANIMKKHSKKNKKEFIYDKSLDIEKEYKNNIYWTQKIKQAVEDNNIIPYYQALYNVKEERVEKYEALVRLKDGDNIISPSYFLEISKRSGQYKDITKIMIDKSFKEFKNKDVDLGINLTFEDIKDEDIQDYLFDKIDEYNIGSKLVIEIVESEEIEDFVILEDFINRFTTKNCRFAIDDFGSGYSNFENLVKMRADYIKIDGSLIKDIIFSKGHQNIVSMIIGFAKDQGFKIIAEYVSSKEIYDKVKELGVDYAQGYYIHTPSDKIED
ncbi:EAL domain-containing protein [Arcobacter porcinus]|uniref:Cyclic di-GMP phosphodiesterase YfgF n=1 Tax=Arcobacter porcinus TaxID=1935204 RepID=A0A1C0AUP8_9BACT|nr:EAL domain-containing protein [Arcobacter porcinus]OCL96630.1 Cyclic di-GMP phosphodiesterase YfgF [Aliarcobacter thereius]OCL83668.1 Cyclic di-GMP phosphodiesterase YfgF [Arcobacter porcinus]OCL83887.1 Cyclic di-GMP phosphodiesterase YfgF [Arcobacter porcinus]OCL85845.1 Cyclic di-GMP phosphodiesterase YfgF [Arcobacter porcinus]OCL89960.1 Cyclic di-GMP phosphodiesterase YfgF [Arcobacter porcinus]